jgi:hypothetical protein
MMLKKTLVLGLVALVTLAAAPKPASKPQAAKSGKAPAAGSAAAGNLDARDPKALIGVLAGVGAQAKIDRQDGDSVFVTVTSPTEIFSAQFAGCNPSGHDCAAVLFDRQGASGSSTLAQLNAFNQSSVLCRLYQDKGGRAHVEYSTQLFANDGRPELLMHLNAWRGCIGDFISFEKDPLSFLAGAA